MIDWNILALVVIALFNAATAYWSYKTRQVATASADNIGKIEMATNSMKDALVMATREAALAKGTAEGLAQGRAEAQTSKP